MNIADFPICDTLAQSWMLARCFAMQILRSTNFFPSYESMFLSLLLDRFMEPIDKLEPYFSLRAVSVRTAIFLLLFFVLEIAQANGDGRQTVYWYYNDFPPYFIVSGSYKGKGAGDQQMNILISQLPQFRHERVLASHSGSVEMMKGQPNVCHTSMFKTTERAGDLEYSLPILRNFSNGFITLRGRLGQFSPFINDSGKLRLNNFLHDGTYRLGIVGGRSFGKGIDAALQAHADNQSVITVSSNDGLASRLLKLVSQHEYDAVIGYSYELEYVVRQLSLNPSDFIFVPVEEEISLQPVYVACSRSRFGKQVISAVNLVISNPITRRKIESAYRFWLDEKSMAQWDKLHM